MASATFYWKRVIVKQKALTVTQPKVASGLVTGLLAQSISWWVVAKSTDGRTFTTPTTTAASPCP